VEEEHPKTDGADRVAEASQPAPSPAESAGAVAVHVATPLPGLFAALRRADEATSPFAVAPSTLAAVDSGEGGFEMESTVAVDLLAPPARPLCPMCGFASRDPAWCDRCGAELAPAPREAKAVGLERGAVVVLGGETVTLVEWMGPRATTLRWRARTADGRDVEVIESDPRATTGVDADLAKVLESLPASRRPLAETRHLGRRLLLYAPLPEGARTIDAWLESAPLAPITALEHTLAVAQALRPIHDAGCVLLGLPTDRIWLGGPLVLFDLEGAVTRCGDTGAPYSPTRGFSPPEAFGRGERGVSPASDVFALGMLFYYFLTGAPRIVEVADSGVELPAPRDWNPALPFGLEAPFRRATERLASRRTPTVASFESELLIARESLRRASQAAYTRVTHSIACDGHIGIAKGKARPVNEDAFFAAIDDTRSRALACVADGVSHAVLGDGHAASEIVVATIGSRWQRLRDGRLFADANELPARVAANLLASMARAANDALIERVNEITDDVIPHPSEVMASTLVLALLDGNRLHLCNLGDSRAYLLRAGALERLTADHDLRHEMLRARRSLAEVDATPGGSQITRFVGRLSRDGDRWIAHEPGAEVTHWTIEAGDRLLLCSDGLSDYVGPSEAEANAVIAGALAEHRDGARAAFELVVLANRGGGGDNITCIVVDVRAPASVED
jgi:protein phosphatase